MLFEKEIRTIANESEDVKLLMSIPGIDYYLASLLSSFIGDIRRFPSDKQLASFFGIVPSNRESSGTMRNMSKEGSRTARWALSIMTDTVMNGNRQVKRFYEKTKKRKVKGKLAHVATSRKLVRMIHHMLTERESWKWENESLTEKKIERLEGGKKGD